MRNDNLDRTEGILALCGPKKESKYRILTNGLSFKIQERQERGFWARLFGAPEWEDLGHYEGTYFIPKFYETLAEAELKKAQFENFDARWHDWRPA